MRVHDLLRLKAGAKLADAEAPSWVADALAIAPFVVVRREEQRGDLISVGVRGATREQRHAATLHAHDVDATTTPEMLAGAAAWRTSSRNTLRAFLVLDPVAAAAKEFDLAWGPGGSVGFELASGMSTVHDNSDLDIVLRPAPRHSRDVLAAFAHATQGLPARVDSVLESAQGAVSLREWLLSPERVLIKTRDGPQLGTFHW